MKLIEYMSSKESGMEDREEVNIVRPLPWLSASVAQFKSLLAMDDQIVKEKILRPGGKQRNVSKAPPLPVPGLKFMSLSGLSPSCIYKLTLPSVSS